MYIIQCHIYIITIIIAVIIIIATVLLLLLLCYYLSLLSLYIELHTHTTHTQNTHTHIHRTHMYKTVNQQTSENVYMIDHTCVLLCSIVYVYPWYIHRRQLSAPSKAERQERERQKRIEEATTWRNCWDPTTESMLEFQCNHGSKTMIHHDKPMGFWAALFSDTPIQYVKLLQQVWNMADPRMAWQLHPCLPEEERERRELEEQLEEEAGIFKKCSECLWSIIYQSFL